MEPALRSITRSLRSDYCLLGFVLLIAAAARAGLWLRAPAFIIADSENYFLAGFQLARGFGLAYLEARRTPIYPGFIAAVVSWLGQDLAALTLAQHLLGLITVTLTYATARALFGRAAAFIASLMVALNGSLLLSEHTVSSETLFTALLMACCCLSVRAMQRGARWLWLPAGLLFGLASLTRPVGLGLIPAVPIAFALLRPGRRQWLLASGLFGLGVALVILPWMTRNYVELRVFSTEGAFGQTLVGRTVRHDRFQFVDPAAPTDADPTRQRARELMHEAASRGSFITPLRRRLIQELGLSGELEANRLMRDLAIEAILRQPGYYLLSTGRFFVTLAVGAPDRLRDAWQTRRDPEAREEWESHPEIAALLGPPTALQERQYLEAEQIVALFQPARFGPLLLALAAVGAGTALLGPSRYRPAALPALLAVGLLLIGVAFVGPVLRYRYPAEPFLAILSAGGLTLLLGAVRDRRWPGTGRPLTTNH